MNFITEILISIMIVLFAIFLLKFLPPQKSTKRSIKDLYNESKKWTGNQKNFVKWKKYQYNQAFSTVSKFIPFIILIITVILGFKNEIINSSGLLPILTFFSCLFFVIKRIVDIIGQANTNAVEGMKYLLQTYFSK